MAKHQFPKGHEKIGGRQKGSVNKLTANIRDIVLDIVAQQGVKPYEALERLRLNDEDAYLKHYIALMKLVMPKDINLNNSGFHIIVKRKDDKDVEDVEPLKE